MWEQQSVMDIITFHYDTVLSDVHLLQPNARHLMARLNRVGQPVFVSKFKLISTAVEEGLHSDTQEDSGTEDEKGNPPAAEEEEDRTVQPILDEDGDLEVPRRPRQSTQTESVGRTQVCPTILSQATASHEDEEQDDEDHQVLKDVIRIEHTMATTLEDVGKQVWRGAFLLADYILSQSSTFRGATVLELGAGTGLTSVVMATLAKTVYCTDVGEDLLSMCQQNVTSNRHLTEPAGGEIKVRQLDWLQHDLCTDADAEFSWTEEEVSDLHDNSSFILAADVCYDDELTDALFRTIYRLCSNFLQPSTVFLSIEKRLNFTVRHMDISCEAYDHFRHCLSQLRSMEDGRRSFQVEQVPSTFPQFMHYERIEQLELWRVTATPLHLKRASPVTVLLPS